MTVHQLTPPGAAAHGRCPVCDRIGDLEDPIRRVGDLAEVLTRMMGTFNEEDRDVLGFVWACLHDTGRELQEQFEALHAARSGRPAPAGGEG